MTTVDLQKRLDSDAAWLVRKEKLVKQIQDAIEICHSQQPSSEEKLASLGECPFHSIAAESRLHHMYMGEEFENLLVALLNLLSRSDTSRSWVRDGIAELTTYPLLYLLSLHELDERKLAGLLETVYKLLKNPIAWSTRTRFFLETASLCLEMHQAAAGTKLKDKTKESLKQLVVDAGKETALLACGLAADAIVAALTVSSAGGPIGIAFCFGLCLVGVAGVFAFECWQLCGKTKDVKALLLALPTRNKYRHGPKFLSFDTFLHAVEGDIKKLRKKTIEGNYAWYTKYAGMEAMTEAALSLVRFFEKTKARNLSEEEAMKKSCLEVMRSIFGRTEGNYRDYSNSYFGVAATVGQCGLASGSQWMRHAAYRNLFQLHRAGKKAGLTTAVGVLDEIYALLLDRNKVDGAVMQQALDSVKEEDTREENDTPLRKVDIQVLRAEIHALRGSDDAEVAKFVKDIIKLKVREGRILAVTPRQQSATPRDALRNRLESSKITLVRLCSDELGRDDEYVDLQCKRVERIVGSLLEHTLTFCRSRKSADRTHLLVVLGQPGSGKTTLLTKIQQHLWNQYLPSVGGRKFWLPIRIQLSQVTLDNQHSMVAGACRQIGITFQELAEQDELEPVFLLDGFHEMGIPLSLVDTDLPLTQGYKVVLTSTADAYEASTSILLSRFGVPGTPVPSWIDPEVIEIAPMKKEKRREFVDKFCYLKEVELRLLPRALEDFNAGIKQETVNFPHEAVHPCRLVLDHFFKGYPQNRNLTIGDWVQARHRTLYKEMADSWHRWQAQKLLRSHALRDPHLQGALDRLFPEEENFLVTIVGVASVISRYSALIARRMMNSRDQQQGSTATPLFCHTLCPRLPVLLRAMMVTVDVKSGEVKFIDEGILNYFASL